MNDNIDKRLENVEIRQEVMEKRMEDMEKKKNCCSSDNPTSHFEGYQETESEKEEDTAVKQNADEQYNIPTLRPEDGNLILLDDAQLEGLLKNCNKENVVQGRFGKVYITNNKVPGLDVRLAIKEITCRSEDKYELLSAANEMIASRVFHFATVPLNAYIDKELQDGQRAFYFISPFFENGNLLDCIASDANGKDIKLNKNKRKRILYQLASAIDFLHTKVSGIRGTVLLVDFSSNNVVLDKQWNGRLIDFGLACELNEKETNRSCTREFGKPGYRYTSIDFKLRVYDDYHNFGVGKYLCIFL